MDKYNTIQYNYSTHSNASLSIIWFFLAYCLWVHRMKLAPRNNIIIINCAFTLIYENVIDCFTKKKVAEVEMIVEILGFRWWLVNMQSMYIVLGELMFLTFEISNSDVWNHWKLYHPIWTNTSYLNKWKYYSRFRRLTLRWQLGSQALKW